MRLAACLLSCILTCVIPAQALELVVNGDFEEPLTTGWTSEGWGPGGSVYRSTGIDPDPDYEAQLRKTTGVGSYRLHQFVALPSLDVEFSCQARITVSATSTAWAMGAITLTYTDAAGLDLGETLLLSRTYYCPWIECATRHLIPIEDTNWHTYAFNLATELANLPGVDPQSVKGVRIALLGGAGDC